VFPPGPRRAGCPSLLEGQTELSAEFARAFSRKAEGTRIAAASNPAQRDQTRAKRRAESARNVRTALSPVNALSREVAARAPNLVNVYVKAREPIPAGTSQLVIRFTLRADDLSFFQGLCEFNGDAAREMIVARARRVHIFAWK